MEDAFTRDIYSVHMTGTSKEDASTRDIYSATEVTPK